MIDTIELYQIYTAVSDTRFSGVKFDGKLSFKARVDILLVKCNNGLFSI